MATYNVSPKFLILFLAASPIFTFASRIPLADDQNEEQNDVENLPRFISEIGSVENVTYWKEDFFLTQSESRINCGNYRLQLVRFRNREHVEWAIENGMYNSWTDGITFYDRGMYTPEVDSSINIVHYVNHGLQTDRFNSLKRLIDWPANEYHLSICTSTSPANYIPLQANVAAHVLIKGEEEEEKVKDAEYIERNDEAAPKELTSLGIYEGYEYCQASSRTYCETLGEGFHLALLDNKGHLDFVISQGIEDAIWTGFTGLITRDLFRWGNNSPINPDIPITINAHKLGLHIRADAANPRLQASIEHAERPCLCRVQVAVSQV